MFLMVTDIFLFFEFVMDLFDALILLHRYAEILQATTLVGIFLILLLAWSHSLICKWVFLNDMKLVGIQLQF